MEKILYEPNELKKEVRNIKNGTTIQLQEDSSSSKVFFNLPLRNIEDLEALEESIRVIKHEKKNC